MMLVYYNSCFKTQNVFLVGHSQWWHSGRPPVLTCEWHNRMSRLGRLAEGMFDGGDQKATTENGFKATLY